MSLQDPLFTIEEVLLRLGENKQQGCLLVFKDAELIMIYVQEGFVLNATSDRRTGKEAVEQAVHLTDASYQWLRGVRPPDPVHSIYLNIQEFLLKSGDIYKNKIAETSRLHGRVVEPADESKYRYFLIPASQPATKLYLTKSASVIGRNKSSDLVIDGNNVSGRHCILDIHRRGLFILDLDSTNGTYINGVLVKDGYVNPGDVLELGDYRFTVNRELRDSA
ncbi:MAG: FHA domain-containing protein [Methylacidiphilales bacterium]|nr:FHA domain-containing protein [Candidatus Methylacidiphilales bacterium]